ncbi:hypothetical protein CBR_g36243 [Chara braunii]|uniref:Uncharacterized protein n=1 Tax=Chara braunii TaxID=69332 RepID=A0A388LKF0_CHABU|nr:hypothetical protein CBR_g36243 [Chara braunii]|eukprot:GBG82715.1 hypothetical protein CBR_g36243 [Chara braunii]
MAGGTTSDGILAKPHDSLEFSLPLFIIQLTIVLALTRFLALLLRPLRQPRVIAEVIGGILLGPTALGNIDGFTAKLFNKDSLKRLDLVANFGLTFFLFMVGLELDPDALKASGTITTAISIAGMFFPFVLGIGVSFFLYNDTDTMEGLKDANSKIGFGPFLVFMGVAMAITAFPVLARILAEFKLLTTEIGGLAMSAAAVDDIMAWVLLALAVALANAHGSNPVVALYDLLMGVGFVIVMFVAVRPLVKKFVQKVTTDDHIPEYLVTLSFIGCLLSGFLTDLMGIHVIFGAFLFGLILPKEGNFAHSLISKLEDFVGTLLLPLYFVSSGLKTEVASVNSIKLFGVLVLVIATATAGKVCGVYFAARLSKLPPRKALTFGVLMNTKGLVELIVLNIGYEKNVIGKTLFTIMVLMALFTTFVTSPIVAYLTKRDQPVSYDARTIASYEAADDASDLRLFMCAHGLRNIPALAHLSDLSKGRSGGRKKKGLRVYLLHLVEYTERSSSLMLVAKARKGGKPTVSKKIPGIDDVGSMFQTYGRLAKVNVKTMMVVSGTSDMHEDICSTAVDKKANMVVLPFHKYLGADGSVDANLVGFHRVNLRVLRHAPCSVGILIDRGFGGSANVPSSETSYDILLLFFGGPDDREALAYASRMLGHPNVNLRVVRFKALTPKDVTVHVGVEVSGQHSQRHSRFHWPGGSAHHRQPQEISAKEKEIALEESKRYAAAEASQDEVALEMLRTKISSPADEKSSQQATQPSPQCTIEEVQTDDVIQAAVRAASVRNIDLIVVGRGRRPAPIVASVPVQDHANRVDSHELGVIGDALVATDTVVKASILIIQQHDADLVGVPTGQSSRFPVTTAALTQSGRKARDISKNGKGQEAKDIEGKHVDKQGP